MTEVLSEVKLKTTRTIMPKLYYTNYNGHI